MVRKVRFPLKMANAAQVRTLDQLRENFDLASVLGYYDNGRLMEWLPFKRGDILTIPANNERNNEYVFVLDSLPHDNPKLYAKMISGETGDGGQEAWGLFADDKGLLYGDHTGQLDSCEYYRGKLNGNKSILHYVSLFIQNEIGLPELLAMQCQYGEGTAWTFNDRGFSLPFWLSTSVAGLG